MNLFTFEVFRLLFHTGCLFKFTGLGLVSPAIQNAKLNVGNDYLAMY